MRPEWDDYFLMIEADIAARSTCVRRHVGAVIVRDKRILTTGYNGAPKDLDHCTDKTCLRNVRKIPSGSRLDICRGVHAEMNAILQAAIHGVRVGGAALYCTNQPCLLCLKAMINVGITRMVISDSYDDPLAQQLLDESEITVIMRPDPAPSPQESGDA